MDSGYGLQEDPPEIRRQILKDVELRDRPASRVESLQWEFSRSPITGAIGPNAELAEFLRQHNIEIVINE